MGLLPRSTTHARSVQSLPRLVVYAYLLQCVAEGRLAWVANVLPAVIGLIQYETEIQDPIPKGVYRRGGGAAEELLPEITARQPGWTPDRSAVWQQLCAALPFGHTLAWLSSLCRLIAEPTASLAMIELVAKALAPLCPLIPAGECRPPVDGSGCSSGVQSFPRTCLLLVRLSLLSMLAVFFFRHHHLLCVDSGWAPHQCLFACCFSAHSLGHGGSGSPATQPNPAWSLAATAAGISQGAAGPARAVRAGLSQTTGSGYLPYIPTSFSFCHGLNHRFTRAAAFPKSPNQG